MRMTPHLCPPAVFQPPQVFEHHGGPATGIAHRYQSVPVEKRSRARPGHREALLRGSRRLADDRRRVGSARIVTSRDLEVYCTKLLQSTFIQKRREHLGEGINVF